jgi:hypothetical protein
VSARLLVMNFEIGALAARLALPSIAREYFETKSLVFLGFKPLFAHG